MVGLAVVAVAGSFNDSSIDIIDSGANIVVLALVVGLVYSSLLPTDASAAMISVTAAVVVVAAASGWLFLRQRR